MENDLLIYGDLLFDNLDELLDFSKEEEAQMLSAVEAPTTAAVPSCLFPCPDATADLTEAPADMGAAAGASDDTFFCDDLDVAEMEWLSNFVEESFSPASIANVSNGTVMSATITTSGSNSYIKIDEEDNNNGYYLHHQLDMLSVGSNNGNQEEEDLLYQASSPLSVLEHNGVLINRSMSSSSSSMSSPTSSSCSGVISNLNPPLWSAERGRAPRTKRTRPLTFPHIAEDPTDSAEDPAPKKMKKFKIRISQLAPPPTVVASFTAATNGGCEGEVRKCLHCGIQKTPQWRLGPMGPKTLCNACGVRYKSGRLFPEYRPAASPTFVESVHSNSHKKVVEMRMSRTGGEEEGDATVKKKQVSSKCCELLNYIKGSKKDWGAHDERKDRGGLVA